MGLIKQEKTLEIPLVYILLHFFSLSAVIFENFYTYISQESFLFPWLI